MSSHEQQLETSNFPFGICHGQLSNRSATVFSSSATATIPATSNKQLHKLSRRR
jgi:hypothetical protein